MHAAGNIHAGRNWRAIKPECTLDDVETGAQQTCGRIERWYTGWNPTGRRLSTLREIETIDEMTVLADPGVEVVIAGCGYRYLIAAELQAIGPDPGVIATALVECADRCSI